MAEGPSHDPTVANPSADEDTESDSRAESIVAMTSSPTHGATLMTKGQIPELSDFFKKTSVTDDEHQAYHEHVWLIGNIIYSVTEVDVPTIEGSTIVCFKSHLVARLGLPPSKFLVTIMGYLNCELFHFNPNAISAVARPLGRWEKLAFECLRLSNPSREPAEGTAAFFSICQ
jgi:hypothetical protein